MLFVGIDIAKKKHQIAIINHKGKIFEDSLVINNDRADFEYLNSLLEDLMKENGEVCKIALERTGHYSDALFYYLKHEKGYLLKAYNPLIIKEFSKSQSLRKTKTDKTDALLIAHKLRSDLNDDKDYYDFDDDYYLKLKNTIKTVRFYKQLIKETDKEIKESLDERPSPLLTIPGISYRLTSVILAEYGNIHKFDNPGQMLAFAGLEPSVNQSGDFEGKGKMVKRGSTHLRWALGQAAENVVRYSNTFNQYYRKKSNEGKHYNVVISHCAKKLVRVIYSLLNNNSIFIDG